MVTYLSSKETFSYSKLTMIAFKKLFLSLTKSIICLILFKKKSSKLYFLNFMKQFAQ